MRPSPGTLATIVEVDGEQAGSRAALDDAPVVDDGDLVAEMFGLVHRVRGEHNGGTVVAQLTETASQLGGGPE